MLQKHKVICVRLTPSERLILRAAARRLGMSVSGLLREGAWQIISRELLQTSEVSAEMGREEHVAR
jgi:hypothetical protein